MNHESPSKFFIALKALSTNTSPQTSATMEFFVSDFTIELEDMFHDGNRQQSFGTIPPETKRLEKQWCARWNPI
jgi:hypothetical protein